VLTVMYPLGFVYIRGCGPQNLLGSEVSKVFLTRVIHIWIYIYIHIFSVFLRVHVLRGSNVYIQYLCG